MTNPEIKFNRIDLALIFIALDLLEEELIDKPEEREPLSAVRVTREKVMRTIELWMDIEPPPGPLDS